MGSGYHSAKEHGYYGYAMKGWAGKEGVTGDEADGKAARRMAPGRRLSFCMGMRAAYAVLIIAGAVVPVAVRAQQPLLVERTREVEAAEKIVATFVSSHDVLDLHKAVDSIALVSVGPPCAGDGRPCPQKKIEKDPRLATLWLKLFAALDLAHAELAGKVKPVYTDVLPPGEAGIQYGGQVAPSEIKDPALRKQYEAAIAENEKNIVVSNHYAEIRTLREQADSDFWLWAGSTYRGDLGAREEMTKEAAALGCSQQRIEWISAIVGEPVNAFPPADPSPSPTSAQLNLP
jgi:hypothetical protein